jgi:hypothetical protein
MPEIRLLRIGARGIAVTGVVLVAAGAAASGLTSRIARHPKPLQVRAGPASNAGPIGVAAAYRYPLACLSVTIVTGDPAYAAARLNRVSPCWRYGVYTTTIFHRVAGVWRMVLQTSAPSCEVTSLPAPVRAQLGLCGEAGRAGQSSYP